MVGNLVDWTWLPSGIDGSLVRFTALPVAPPLETKDRLITLVAISAV